MSVKVCKVGWGIFCHRNETFDTLITKNPAGLVSQKLMLPVMVQKHEWEGVPVLYSDVVETPVVNAGLQGRVLLTHKKKKNPAPAGEEEGRMMYSSTAFLAGPERE